MYSREVAHWCHSGRRTITSIYLLHCWAEATLGPAQPVVWRVNLEDPRTGQRRGVTSLAVLLAVLQGDLAAGEDGARAPPGPAP